MTSNATRGANSTPPRSKPVKRPDAPTAKPRSETTRKRWDQPSDRKRRTQVQVRAELHRQALAGEITFHQTVVVPDDQVEYALLLWLRGENYAAIGRTLGVHRDTARELVRQAYVESAAARGEKMAERIDEAIARMRLVQRQAWADHDADEDREVKLLTLAVNGDAERARYQSQRAQYLRVVLEAEREIARLQGLYDAALLASATDHGGGAFVLRIERARDAASAVVEEYGSPVVEAADGTGG